MLALKRGCWEGPPPRVPDDGNRTASGIVHDSDAGHALTPAFRDCWRRVTLRRSRCMSSTHPLPSSRRKGNAPS